MEAVREYEGKLDAKRRLTLRGAAFDYYHIAEYSDGRIVLSPRVLTEPFCVSEKTLDMMDESVRNMKGGNVSEPVDLSDLE